MTLQENVPESQLGWLAGRCCESHPSHLIIMDSGTLHKRLHSYSNLLSTLLMRRVTKSEDSHEVSKRLLGGPLFSYRRYQANGVNKMTWPSLKKMRKGNEGYLHKRFRFIRSAQTGHQGPLDIILIELIN